MILLYDLKGVNKTPDLPGADPGYDLGEALQNRNQDKLNYFTIRGAGTGGGAKDALSWY